MKLLDGTVGNAGTVSYHVGAKSNDRVNVVFAEFDLAAQPLTTARTINTRANASTALTSIDGAINQINTARSTWGAAMNRLVHAGDNAANVSMNLTESSSRIMDTDYALEAAKLATQQILQQSSSAMLAQANALPNSVLSLLDQQLG
jgi:flagellin